MLLLPSAETPTIVQVQVPRQLDFFDAISPKLTIDFQTSYKLSMKSKTTQK
jgi:hypothetical protein